MYSENKRSCSSLNFFERNTFLEIGWQAFALLERLRKENAIGEWSDKSSSYIFIGESAMECVAWSCAKIHGGIDVKALSMIAHEFVPA